MLSRLLSEILQQKDEEAVINGVQGVAIKTKENETLTITSDLDSLLVKLDCGKNIEADMVTNGGMKVEWAEQSIVKVETIQYMGNRRKDPSYTFKCLSLANEYSHGVCGQPHYEDYRENEEDIAKLSVKKNIENSRFDLALLDSHTNREKFFCDNVQNLVENEDTGTGTKSDVTEEAICQLLGPVFVTAFSGFKYFARHAGNFQLFSITQFQRQFLYRRKF